MNELKPCPFCGGKAELIIAPGYFKQGLSSSGWLVKCTNGCCNQMPHVSDHDAVEAWNKRAESCNNLQSKLQQLATISWPHENNRLNNQVHLCNSCKYDFPDCPSKNDDIVFGNGAGNDNVCACAKYSHSVSEDTIEKMSELLVEWLMESDFGYDNLGDLYDKYKDDIKSMSYSDGLVYIAKMEVLRNERSDFKKRGA